MGAFLILIWALKRQPADHPRNETVKQIHKPANGGASVLDVLNT